MTAGRTVAGTLVVFAVSAERCLACEGPDIGRVTIGSVGLAKDDDTGRLATVGARCCPLVVALPGLVCGKGFRAVPTTGRRVCVVEANGFAWVMRAWLILRFAKTGLLNSSPTMRSQRSNQVIRR